MPDKINRPYWDALGAQDYMAAIKAMEIGEREYPKHPLPVAYSLYAATMGKKWDLVEEKIEKLRKIGPNDEETFHVLRFGLRKSRYAQVLVELLERCVTYGEKKRPDMLKSLTLEHFRFANFKRLRTLSTTLYINTKDNGYLIWGATAVGLLAQQFLEKVAIQQTQHAIIIAAQQSQTDVEAVNAVADDDDDDDDDNRDENNINDKNTTNQNGELSSDDEANSVNNLNEICYKKKQELLKLQQLEKILSNPTIETTMRNKPLKTTLSARLQSGKELLKLVLNTEQLIQRVFTPAQNNDDKNSTNNKILSLLKQSTLGSKGSDYRDRKILNSAWFVQFFSLYHQMGLISTVNQQIEDRLSELDFFEQNLSKRSKNTTPNAQSGIKLGPETIKKLRPSVVNFDPYGPLFQLKNQSLYDLSTTNIFQKLPQLIPADKFIASLPTFDVTAPLSTATIESAIQALELLESPLATDFRSRKRQDFLMLKLKLLLYTLTVYKTGESISHPDLPQNLSSVGAKSVSEQTEHSPEGSDVNGKHPSLFQQKVRFDQKVLEIKQICLDILHFWPDQWSVIALYSYILILEASEGWNIFKFNTFLQLFLNSPDLCSLSHTTLKFTPNPLVLQPLSESHNWYEVFVQNFVFDFETINGFTGSRLGYDGEYFDKIINNSFSQQLNGPEIDKKIQIVNNLGEQNELRYQPPNHVPKHIIDGNYINIAVIYPIPNPISLEQIDKIKTHLLGLWKEANVIKKKSLLPALSAPINPQKQPTVSKTNTAAKSGKGVSNTKNTAQSASTPATVETSAVSTPLTMLDDQGRTKFSNAIQSRGLLLSLLEIDRLALQYNAIVELSMTQWNFNIEKNLVRDIQIDLNTTDVDLNNSRIFSYKNYPLVPLTAYNPSPPDNIALHRDIMIHFVIDVQLYICHYIDRPFFWSDVQPFLNSFSTFQSLFLTFPKFSSFFTILFPLLDNISVDLLLSNVFWSPDIVFDQLNTDYSVKGQGKRDGIDSVEETDRKLGEFKTQFEFMNQKAINRPQIPSYQAIVINLSNSSTRHGTTHHQFALRTIGFHFFKQRRLIQDEKEKLGQKDTHIEGKTRQAFKASSFLRSWGDMITLYTNAFVYSQNVQYLIQDEYDYMAQSYIEHINKEKELSLVQNNQNGQKNQPKNKPQKPPTAANAQKNPSQTELTSEQRTELLSMVDPRAQLLEQRLLQPAYVSLPYLSMPVNNDPSSFSRPPGSNNTNDPSKTTILHVNSLQQYTNALTLAFALDHQNDLFFSKFTQLELTLFSSDQNVLMSSMFKLNQQYVVAIQVIHMVYEHSLDTYSRQLSINHQLDSFKATMNHLELEPTPDQLPLDDTAASLGIMALYMLLDVYSVLSLVPEMWEEQQQNCTQVEHVMGLNVKQIEGENAKSDKNEKEIQNLHNYLNHLKIQHEKSTSLNKTMRIAVVFLNRSFPTPNAIFSAIIALLYYLQHTFTHEIQSQLLHFKLYSHPYGFNLLEIFRVYNQMAVKQIQWENLAYMSPTNNGLIHFDPKISTILSKSIHSFHLEYMASDLHNQELSFKEDNSHGAISMHRLAHRMFFSNTFFNAQFTLALNEACFVNPVKLNHHGLVMDCLHSDDYDLLDPRERERQEKEKKQKEDNKKEAQKKPVTPAEKKAAALAAAKKKPTQSAPKIDNNEHSINEAPVNHDLPPHMQNLQLIELKNYKNLSAIQIHSALFNSFSSLFATISSTSEGKYVGTLLPSNHTPGLSVQIETPTNFQELLLFVSNRPNNNDLTALLTPSLFPSISSPIPLVQLHQSSSFEHNAQFRMAETTANDVNSHNEVYPTSTPSTNFSIGQFSTARNYSIVETICPPPTIHLTPNRLSNSYAEYTLHHPMVHTFHNNYQPQSGHIGGVPNPTVLCRDVRSSNEYLNDFYHTDDETSLTLRFKLLFNVLLFTLSCPSLYQADNRLGLIPGESAYCVQRGVNITTEPIKNKVNISTFNPTVALLYSVQQGVPQEAEYGDPADNSIKQLYKWTNGMTINSFIQQYEQSISDYYRCVYSSIVQQHSISGEIIQENYDLNLLNTIQEWDKFSLSQNSQGLDRENSAFLRQKRFENFSRVCQHSAQSTRKHLDLPIKSITHESKLLNLTVDAFKLLSTIVSVEHDGSTEGRLQFESIYSHQVSQIRLIFNAVSDLFHNAFLELTERQKALDSDKKTELDMLTFITDRLLYSQNYFERLVSLYTTYLAPILLLLIQRYNIHEAVNIPQANSLSQQPPDEVDTPLPQFDSRIGFSDIYSFYLVYHTWYQQGIRSLIDLQETHHIKGGDFSHFLTQQQLSTSPVDRLTGDILHFRVQANHNHNNGSENENGKTLLQLDLSPGVQLPPIIREQQIYFLSQRLWNAQYIFETYISTLHSYQAAMYVSPSYKADIELSNKAVKEIDTIKASASTTTASTGGKPGDKKQPQQHKNTPSGKSQKQPQTAAAATPHVAALTTPAQLCSQDVPLPQYLIDRLITFNTISALTSPIEAINRAIASKREAEIVANETQSNRMSKWMTLCQQFPNQYRPHDFQNTPNVDILFTQHGFDHLNHHNSVNNHIAPTGAKNLAFVNSIFDVTLPKPASTTSLPTDNNSSNDSNDNGVTGDLPLAALKEMHDAAVDMQRFLSQSKKRAELQKGRYGPKTPDLSEEEMTLFISQLDSAQKNDATGNNNAQVGETMSGGDGNTNYCFDDNSPSPPMDFSTSISAKLLATFEKK
jgi:hypothetical protein